MSLIDRDVEDLVAVALAEDLADGGDVTTLATVPADLAGHAELTARAAGVIAGIDLVTSVYRQLDTRIRVDVMAAEGAHVAPGDVVGVVEGPLQAILTGERTALNLVTHLSGVSTMTRAFVDAVDGTGCAVRDTRKTTPGMRRLEKAAVLAGGGVNHRVGLFDGVLVKDNHVAAAGSVGAATRLALAAAGSLPVQVEVDTLDQLVEALEAGARDVLLDNFTPEQTAEAVRYVRALEATHGVVLLESSGTITLDTVRAYAETGVDRVSVGALTHSAPQLDLALDVRIA